MAEVKISDLPPAIEAGADQEIEINNGGNSLKLTIGQLRDWVLDQVEKVDGVPSGAIAIWYGSLTTIPDGWVYCNGQNGTPDLRNRVPFGAGSLLAFEEVTNGTVPNHDHPAGGLSTSSAGNHSHGGNIGANGGHTHTGSTNAAGAHNHSWGEYRTAGGFTPVTYYLTGSDSGRQNTSYTSTAGNHSHSLSINSNGNHSHSLAINNAGAHSHSVTGRTGFGGEGAHNIPRSLGVYFIMKL